jgi:hypothetical protein
MRTRTRTESVILGGDEASGSDRIDSFDGRGIGNGSFSEAPVFSFGTGGTGRAGEDDVSKTSWFAPVESSTSPDVLSFGECKDGVCPVPWATKEEPPVIQDDQVNHPPHYTEGGIETIEAIEAELTAEEYRGYMKGNITKYIWRERLKGGTQSLKKAQWYLDRLIQFDEVQNG